MPIESDNTSTNEHISEESDISNSDDDDQCDVYIDDQAEIYIRKSRYCMINSY